MSKEKKERNSRIVGSGTTPILVASLQAKRIKLVGRPSQKATSFM